MATKKNSSKIQKTEKRPKGSRNKSSALPLQAPSKQDLDNALLSFNEGVATITLDLSGEKMNLLTTAMMESIDNALSKAVKKKPKALVIKSAKPGCFIAGADIKEIKAIRNDRQKIEEKVAHGQSILNRIENFPAPTFAVINGVALGGGLELALACSWRIASEDPHTRLGLPEVQLGILPGFGGTQRLPEILPIANALFMMTTGKSLSGKAAFKLGLVDACWPADYIEFKLSHFIASIVSSANSAHLKREKKRKARRFFERIPFAKGFVYRGFLKAIAKKSAGHYPAPSEIVHVVKKTNGSNLALESRLEVERRAFVHLALSSISHNLIDIFSYSTALKRESFAKLLAETPMRKSDVKSKKRKAKTTLPFAPIKHTAVVGAGVMGGGIAWLFSTLNCSVRLFDIDRKALALGLQYISEYEAAAVKFQKIAPRIVENRRALITTSTTDEQLPHVDFAIEAVSEKMEIKQKIYSSLEKRLGHDAIIATNTSSLPITKLSSKLKVKQRFLGVHFFNPVNRMPLVEIIPSSHTSSTVVGQTVKLMRQCKKVPIVVKDSPGFLVNRILFPYMNEAAILLGETNKLEKIDAIFLGFGMPMGPLRLLDEVGFDVAQEVALVLEKAYGERMKTSKLLRHITENTKLLGKKNGAGFYLYDKKGKVIGPNPTMAAIVQQVGLDGDKNRVSDSQILRRPLFLMANEAAMCLSEGIAEKAWHIDMAMIYGIGFPPYAGGLLKFIDNLGHAETISVMTDLASRFGERFRADKSLEKMHAAGETYYS